MNNENILISTFNGFCMALADSVPGVSGGTIAFIMGFYEKFLDSLNGLFGRSTSSRKSGIRYLLKLGLGWCIGMCLSVLILSGMFERNIYFLSSLFIGLTLASVPFIVIQEKETMKGRPDGILYLAAGAVLVWAASAFHGAGTGIAVDFSDANLMQMLYIFISGAVAITAMVLPGISGSTMLLISGVYLPTISALRQIMGLRLSVLPGLAALTLGILFGIAVFIRFIRMGLKNFRPQMLYFIIGLMIGSVYAIIMGPTTLKNAQAAMTLHTFELTGFISGILVLVGLEALKKKIQERRT